MKTLIKTSTILTKKMYRVNQNYFSKEFWDQRKKLEKIIEA